MKRLHSIQLTKKTSIHLENFGQGFSGGITLIPTITIYVHRNGLHRLYINLAFTWLFKTISIAIIN